MPENGRVSSPLLCNVWTQERRQRFAPPRECELSHPLHRQYTIYGVHGQDLWLSGAAGPHCEVIRWVPRSRAESLLLTRTILSEALAEFYEIPKPFQVRKVKLEISTAMSASQKRNCGRKKIGQDGWPRSGTSREEQMMMMINICMESGGKDKRALALSGLGLCR
ncbi:hypothetical protein VTO42DRAFT_3053 [Malbranchea cinnamomea]